MRRHLAAATLLGLALVTASTPAKAASVLSAASVSPTAGTTATAFSFTVHYTSTDSPTRPAQAVWAQVAGATVPLVKVSGSAHDGTWQGTATISAGVWQVVFQASTSGEAQPEVLQGPIVTVTRPPPTPQPITAPTPLATAPTTRATLPPSLTPPSTPIASPTFSASGFREPRSSLPPPTRTAAAEAAEDGSSAPAGPMLASLLILGGTMSVAGATLLVRQWFVSRRASPL